MHQADNQYFSYYQFILLIKFILINQINRFLIFVLLETLPYLIER